MKYFINLLFALYFVILFGERIQSLARSMRKGVKVIGDGFNTYTYILTILSIIAAVILLIIFGRNMFIGIFTQKNDIYEKIDYGMISVIAGVILFSGMVHTEYTIPGIQFAAYGALVAAMILQTLTNGKEWISLIYVVFFSMAIPVMYRTQIDKSTIFYLIEAVVSVAMVIAFTFMLRDIMNGIGVNTFNVIIIIFAIIGDALILAFRWKEKINTFVLMFIVLTTIMWVVGRITVRGEVKWH